MKFTKWLLKSLLQVFALVIAYGLAMRIFGFQDAVIILLFLIVYKLYAPEYKAVWASATKAETVPLENT